MRAPFSMFDAWKYTNFCESRKVHFGAAMQARAWFFMILLKESWKTNLIAKPRFWMDVSANIDIFQKIDNKKHHFLISKRTPKETQNEDNFNALICVASRGLLLERQAHILRDVSCETTVSSMAIFRIWSKNGSQNDAKKAFNLTLISHGFSRRFSCRFLAHVFSRQGGGGGP